MISQFHDYLVCDGANQYSRPVRENDLAIVYCNLHARRRFRETLVGLGASEKTKRAIAAQAIKRYRVLYRLEAKLKEATPAHRYRERQRVAIPRRDDFVTWAHHTHDDGVAVSAKTGPVLSEVDERTPGLGSRRADRADRWRLRASAPSVQDRCRTR